MDDLSNHPADKASRPIVGECWDIEGPQAIPMHSHRRGQLIYTARGVVTVETDAFLYVLPPHRALWLPPESKHAARYPSAVAFRGLYVAPDHCPGLPAIATVVQVDTLTRELIEATARIPWDYPLEGPEARLMAVVLDRIVALPTAPLDLPRGQDRAVRRVMAGLENFPGDDRPQSAWAAEVGVSDRTLSRRFLAETGMNFSAWRERLRILRAVERIGAGEPISVVAVDLGYATPSSFSTMFRRVMGVAPSAYFD